MPQIFNLNLSLTVLLKLKTHTNVPGNIRNVDKLIIPFAYSKTRMFTIKWIGPRIWNELPTSIQNASHLLLFKKNLKNIT